MVRMQVRQEDSIDVAHTQLGEPFGDSASAIEKQVFVAGLHEGSGFGAVDRHAGPSGSKQSYLGARRLSQEGHAGHGEEE